MKEKLIYLLLSILALMFGFASFLYYRKEVAKLDEAEKELAG